MLPNSSQCAPSRCTSLHLLLLLLVLSCLLPGAAVDQKQGTKPAQKENDEVKKTATGSAQRSKAVGAVRNSEHQLEQAKNNTAVAAALESRAQAAKQNADQVLKAAGKEAADAASLQSRAQTAKLKADTMMEAAQKEAADAAVLRSRTQAANKEANPQDSDDPEDGRLDDSTDLGIAIMLLGSVSFMMCVFYLVNHTDGNIQRYSWKVISSTVSIFSSVLIFQACNKNIVNFVLQGKSCWVVFAVNMLQLAFWIAMMQIVLYFICRSAKEGARSDAHKFEEDIKSYGILLAHISGFAAINAWGTLQQNVVHHIGLQQVWLQQFFAFGVVILASLVMGIVLKVTSKTRHQLYIGDGTIDEWEEKENDLAMETEEDVVGITISFSLVQVVRFVFDHRMPNVEGVYETEGTIKPFRRVLFLLGASLVFALMVMKRPGQLLLGESHKRIRACLKIVWSTSFAWSLYFANYWLVRVMFGSLGDDMIATMTVVLALSSTAIAFACIFGLEQLEEAHLSGDIGRAVKSLILSLAILVGFSWERGFDVALNLIAERFSFILLEDSHYGTGLVVFALACTLSAVVLPAWKWYILPTELKMDREHEEFKAIRAESPSSASPRALERGAVKLPDGYNGSYVRLPGTPPQSPSPMSPAVSQQMPRSPRSSPSSVVAPDIAMLAKRSEALAAQVVSLRNLRLAAWPQDRGPDVAVKCSEWLAKLEMEAGSLSLQLVDSKVSIDEFLAHQAQMEKDVLGMRTELHAAYLQFWGAPAG